MAVEKSCQHIPSVFRRAAALLLALCLLPLWTAWAQAPSGGATNLFGSALADAGEYIHYAAIAGGVLYIKTTEALYAWAPGDAAPARLLDLPRVFHADASPEEVQKAQPNLDILLSDGKTLYTLDTFKQVLYTVSVENGEIVFGSPLALDLSDFMDTYSSSPRVQQPDWGTIMDGRLYLKAVNFGEMTYDLFSFDIKSGEKKSHAAANLFSMTAYKDGKGVALYHDQNNAYDMETGKMILPELVLFDPKDDSVEHLGVFPPAQENAYTKSPLYYDAAQDSLYLFTDTDLYRLDAGFSVTRLIGRLPMMDSYQNMAYGGLLPLPDGRLAITFYLNTFLRERTEKGLEGVAALTIGGSFNESFIMQRVLMEMDGVTMRRVEGVDYGYVDAQTLAAMFLTNSVTVDLMPLSASGFDVDKLMQKGYLADLSGSALIRDYVEKMPPAFSRAVRQDGKIYAVPLDFMAFPWFAYVKPFAELKLTVPTSVREVIALAREWAGGLADANPDYQFLANETNLQQALDRLVLDSYMNHAFATGADLAFDTPLFRGLMGEVEAIDYGDLNMTIDWDTPEGMALGEEMGSRTALFEASMGYEPRYSVGMSNEGEHASVALMLPMDEGMEGFSDTQMTMLAVMSVSGHQDEAMRFIELYISKMHALDRVSYDVTATQPVPNPDYDKELEQRERSLAEMRQRAQAAQGAEQSTMEKDTQEYAQYVERFREQGKLLATEADVQMIHSAVARLYVMNGFMNAQRQALYGNDSLLHQFLDGAITLDQFVRQADDKLRLVRMEYE